MTPLNKLLEFFDVKESLDHQVLEKHNDLMIVRCYDEIMELSCGSFNSEVSVVTCDYEIYHADNIIALTKFKEEYLKAQAALLTKKKAELEVLISPKKQVMGVSLSPISRTINGKMRGLADQYLNGHFDKIIENAANCGTVKYKSHIADALIYGSSIHTVICDEVTADAEIPKRKSKEMRPNPNPPIEHAHWPGGFDIYHSK